MTSQPSQRPSVSGSIRRKETDDFVLYLTLCNAEMEGRLSLEPRKALPALNPETLTGILKELGLRAGIIAAALEDCCRHAASGNPVKDLLIAKGVPPGNGTDASLKFLIKTQHKAEYTADKHGTIDYHETHLFDNVLIGHEIAILQPAVPGTDGYTVTGKILRAPAPKDCPVRAGDGVEFISDANTFVAKLDGYVTLRSNLLQVRDEYVVEGDLDFHTGNIKFRGHVHVCGDVLDGFQIKATKDIRIDRNTGHCRLECGGNMDIGGMNGLGMEAGTAQQQDIVPHPNLTGTILCHGNLTARYLHHTYVECEGNIHVMKEIMHSVIRCAGTVTVDGGIIGGTCTSLAGIESGKIGTEIGIPTELEAGDDYRDIQQETSVAEALALMHREREVLMQEVGPGPFTPEHLATLSENIRLRTMELLGKIHMLDEQAAILKARLAHHGGSAAPNPKINVLRELNIGTIIQLGNTLQKISDPVRGPLSVIEYRNELHFLPMTPLPHHASELQAELRLQERKAILAKAAELGLEHPELLETPDLIRTIQTAEGHAPCFCTGRTPCPTPACCWRRDCQTPPPNS